MWSWVTWSIRSPPREHDPRVAEVRDVQPVAVEQCRGESRAGRPSSRLRPVGRLRPVDRHERLGGCPGGLEGRERLAPGHVAEGLRETLLERRGEGGEDPLGEIVGRTEAVGDREQRAPVGHLAHEHGVLLRGAHEAPVEGRGGARAVSAGGGG